MYQEFCMFRPYLICFNSILLSRYIRLNYSGGGGVQLELNVLGGCFKGTGGKGEFGLCVVMW